MDFFVLTFCKILDLESFALTRAFHFDNGQGAMCHKTAADLDARSCRFLPPFILPLRTCTIISNIAGHALLTYNSERLTILCDMS